MKNKKLSHLECFPCLLRQALEAGKLICDNEDIHHKIVKETLAWIQGADLMQPAPLIGQKIHKRLRELTKLNDPYKDQKIKFNKILLNIIPNIKEKIEKSEDPFETAVKYAIAGNIIDMGAISNLTEIQVIQTLEKVINYPVIGNIQEFKSAVFKAKKILYLGDNAGEIILDSLLLDYLPKEKITFVVRGGPIINDATTDDAVSAGIDLKVKLTNNGSDAPGTILEQCSEEFIKLYTSSDLIISKGQGNFETLFYRKENIYFLFKIKCLANAKRANLPEGAHCLLHSLSGNMTQ